MSTVYTVNNKVLKNAANDKWLAKKVTPPLPPIPSKCIRVRTSDGNAPVKATSTRYESATLVTGTTDVYDVYHSSSFFALLYKSTNVTEVLGANIDGITDMSNMFDSCTSLTNVAVFDTSSVTNMSQTFFHCSSLTSVPLLDTSSVTNMGGMFNGCVNVQSGALALYQQASSQTNPPSNHSATFYNCGSDTITGAAELAQIPSDWK